MENIKFRLLKIDTRQFAILQEAYDSKSEKFQFSFGINFSFPDKENRVVCNSCLIKYQGEVSPFLVLEVTVYFELEENSWNELLDIEADQVRIPKATAHHMMSLLIGTARGVLHSETKNTEFNRLVLPTVNLSELIAGDIIHSFTESSKTENE